MSFNMDLALEAWYTNKNWEYEPEEYTYDDLDEVMEDYDEE